jgi:pilus assembly protein Flp/PilA
MKLPARQFRQVAEPTKNCNIGIRRLEWDACRWRAYRGATGESLAKGESNMPLLAAVLASSRSDEEGQGLAEYALILALIAIVAIIALLFLGGQISGILNQVGSSV